MRPLHLIVVKALKMLEPIVRTENGLLRGAVTRSTEGYQYYFFKGIPYAKPPIGDLRFKDPAPLEKWSGVKDATTFGNICIQYDLLQRTFQGSEDCLYLNVYLRSIKNTAVKKPVMVWFHGGGFTFGSGNDLRFGPDYLLRKDIVLVTFNFRLGVFGFLNLEDKDAPGNQGLKDQLMALKWVQQNIKEFGGDPNNVTIFGESSGSIAVHYMILSPLSKGLIHKAICQSGVAFNSWARFPDTKKYAIQLCNFLGKQLQDSKQILEFLTTAHNHKLADAQEKVRKYSEKLHITVPFGPGVDNKSLHPLMPIPVEEAALDGVHIPFMLGHNSHEGILHLIELKQEEYIFVDKHFDKSINPRVLEILQRYNLTASDVRHLYFKNNKISQANCDVYADMCTDLYFVEGIHRALKVQAEKSLTSTYFYKFSYSEQLSLMKAMLSSPIKGACHFDEVEYIFYVNLRKQLGLQALIKGTPGYKVMERMIEMWTNFATYGSPVPATSELLPEKWLPIDDGTNLRCFNISKQLQMETVPNIQKFLSADKSTVLTS